MNKLIVLLFLLPLLNGCGASSEADENDELVSCLGFGSPSINVEVRDSITESIVDSAYVSIHIQNEDNSSFEALYT